MKNKLVIVDDDIKLAQVWGKWLEKAGYEVHIINDSEEVLPYLETEVPDLLIVDVLMPKTDGIKLAGDIRRDVRLEDVPIILMSAIYKSSDIKAQAGRLANDFLDKPFRKEALLSKVKEFLPLADVSTEELPTVATPAPPVTEISLNDSPTEELPKTSPQIPDLPDDESPAQLIGEPEDSRPPVAAPVAHVAVPKVKSIDHDSSGAFSIDLPPSGDPEDGENIDFDNLFSDADDDIDVPMETETEKKKSKSRTNESIQEELDELMKITKT